MPVVIEFELPEATVLLNAWLQVHIHARDEAMKQLAWKVAAATVGKKPPAPLRRCRIHVDRYSSALPDWDGLYGGLKPLLDVLCCPGQPDKRGRVSHRHGLRFIVDDNPACVLTLTATPHKVPRGISRTRVCIVEAD